jgi:hypothetical protein
MMVDAGPFQVVNNHSGFENECDHNKRVRKPPKQAANGGRHATIKIQEGEHGLTGLCNENCLRDLA